MNKIDQCSLCGMCRVDCPVFKVKLSETDSPRGKAALKKKKESDLVFYKCTLCDMCKVACPVDVDLELVEERKKLVKKGLELATNEVMIKNIREHGNPFGKPKKGKVKDLYCC